MIGEKSWKQSKVGHTGTSPKGGRSPPQRLTYCPSGDLRGASCVGLETISTALQHRARVLRRATPCPGTTFLALAAWVLCQGCLPSCPSPGPFSRESALTLDTQAVSAGAAADLPGSEEDMLRLHPPDQSGKLVPGQLTGRLAPEALQEGGVGTGQKGDRQ